MVIGNAVVEGVPFINGKKAVTCVEDECCLCRQSPLNDVFAGWKCPECGSHLSKDNLICLNGCHLSVASMRRFDNLLEEARMRAHARINGPEVKE